MFDIIRCCSHLKECVVTCVSCPVAFVPPIIDAGTPSDLPLEIDRENTNEKIGSTFHVVQGHSAMIQCSIFADTGLPIDSVDYTWYYMGMQITNGSKFMITVDDSRRSSTLMVNDFQRADNGQFTCVAFNPAGQSQESTEVFVYSDVLIDKGNVSGEIGPGGSLNGKVGDKFLVPIGRRAFINCDLEDAGGFPYDSSANPPLPGSVQWFKDGQLVDLRLFDSSHGNQLCVDTRTASDSGYYECRVKSRIVNERSGDDTIFQTDSATSIVMVLSPGPRYVAIDSQAAVRFPEQVSLVLDCLPFAVNTYGREANLSSIQWFRRELGSTSGGTEIVDSRTMANIFLANNKERLVIAEITIATKAQVGTEASYRCSVCRNEVPPDPRECDTSIVDVNADSPPVLECDIPPPPIDTTQFFIIVDLDIGCDLCVEPGLPVDIVTIMCVPTTSRPFDCIMTTPNGTNVLDINDPTGSLITVQTAGDTVSSVIISPVANPDQLPLGFDVLGTWTCVCTNIDGRSVASSTLGSCLTPPLIDKGIPRPPFGDFPPYVGPGTRSFIIGSNDYLIEGQPFTISCTVLEGDPTPTVQWFKDGTELTGFANLPSITVNETGEYMCTATNIAGTDSAVSRMRPGIEIVRPPIIRKGRPQPVPSTVDFVDQTERIGTDVHVIVGRMATIMCQLDDAGLPPAEIQWIRTAIGLNETLYPLTNGRENLAFPVVSTEDEALYCCSAENVAGIDSACSGLFVRGGGPFLRKGREIPRPVNPVQVYPGTHTVDIGGNAFAIRGANFKVVCQVAFSKPPVTDFSWTFIDSTGMETVIANHGNSSVSEVGIANTVFLVSTNLPGQVSHLIATGNNTGYMVRCTCTSPLGSATATSAFSTFVPPIIDAGMPSDLPLEIVRENMNVKIGSTLRVVQGHSAMIQCSIFAGTGLPIDSVDYTWYYMGMQITNGSKFMITVDDSRRSSTLMVNDFQRADNGQFTCVAFNPAGQSQASTEVFVYSDVLIDKGNVSMEIGPGGSLNGKVGNKFLVPIGRRAFINCDLEDAGGFPNDSSANPPLPVSVQWFKDSQLVDLRLFNSCNSEIKNQLCVDVGSFFDSGNYECRVTSRIVNECFGDYTIFQTDSATSNLMVLSEPVIRGGMLPDPTPGQKAVAVGGPTRVISSGTNVNIRCELVSATMPPSTISWVKVSGGIREPISDDGSKFIITSNDRESELVISAFDSNDIGTYNCIAENSAGNDTALVRLDLCPLEALPCPLDADPSFFNVSVQVTEGLNDTCVYCATWQVTDYGPCSQTCQGGKQTRNVTCVVPTTGAAMPDSACPARPITERPCNEGVVYTPPVIRGGVLPDPIPGQKGVAVGGPTRVISSGTNVNIRCELVSVTMPESAISWAKNVSGGIRDPISDDGSKFIITSNDRESELVISAFDNNDVGTYHCIAANSVGSDTALVRLDLCPPEALPCLLDADPSFFNVSVQVTEGLNDTCVYCATWQMTDYGPCSETCQGGNQTRNVTCIVPTTGASIPDSACPARPITERPCNEGVVCGCIDLNQDCKRVNAKLCRFQAIKKKCCATCSA